MLNEVDEDGSGTIDLNEMMSHIITKMRTIEPQRDLKDAFRQFDRDDKGFLNVEDIRHVMHSLGHRLTYAEVEEMINFADDDKSGTIGYREFVLMFQITMMKEGMTALKPPEKTNESKEIE